MTVDSGILDGISLMFDNLIPNIIQKFLNPPIVYFIAVAMGIIVITLIFELLIGQYNKVDTVDDDGYYDVQLTLFPPEEED